jgi:hypothetical protein
MKFSQEENVLFKTLNLVQTSLRNTSPSSPFLLFIISKTIKLFILILRDLM